MSLEMQETKKEKPKNVVEVETANGIYNISYEIHLYQANTAIIDEADAVIFEGVFDYNSKENINKAFNAMLESPAKDVIARCAELKKPFYIADMNGSLLKYIYLNAEGPLVRGLMGTGELILAAKLFQSAANDIKNPDKISRRNFLQRGGKICGKIAAASYLSTPALENILFGLGIATGGMLNELSYARKAYRGVGGANEIIHPELQTLVVNVRNYLIAQKSEAVAKMNWEGEKGKPRVAMFFGASHFGIEKAMKTDESSRIDWLKRHLGENFAEQGKIILYMAGKNERGEIYCESNQVFEDPAFSK